MSPWSLESCALHVLVNAIVVVGGPVEYVSPSLDPVWPGIRERGRPKLRSGQMRCRRWQVYPRGEDRGGTRVDHGPWEKHPPDATLYELQHQSSLALPAAVLFLAIP
jgi:hypothetical protein